MIKELKNHIRKEIIFKNGISWLKKEKAENF